MYLTRHAILIILFIASLKLTTYASTEVSIYQRIDKNGDISYSDKVSPTAKKINVIPQNTVKVIPVKKRATKSKSRETSPLTTITITSPSDQQTIRDNQGNLSITAEVSQRIPTSYRYQLIIDKNIHTTQPLTANFSVRNIDRGAHEIKIALVDDKGKIIALSGSYTIYMHRASIN